MIRSAIKSGLKKVLGVEFKPAPAAAPPGPPPAWKMPVASVARPETAAVVAEPSALAAAPSEAEPVAPAGSVPPVSGASPAAASPAAPITVAAPADDTAGPALTMEAVQEIMDEMVRPALQGDGGDITLLKVEDNDIYVKLVGSCSTCPSSIMTMKMGVEALLKEEFPVMRSLIQVD